MFNRDGCRYLLSCLAFFEICLSWLFKPSYHPLMFQQQGDSFRMVLPPFLTSQICEQRSSESDLKLIFCNVDNTELLSKNKNENGADFIFFF